MGEMDAANQVYDALILGAGFGGMYMLYELRSRGFSVVGLEAGADTGGAWYWNRYPGARCDVESLAYCYSFSPIIDEEWRWTERYAGQKEIRSYLQWVCDRLDIRKDIRFNSRLAKAHYDEDVHLWNFETENGDSYQARWFVTSPGPLATPIWPNIPGRERFKGQLFHTAKWPDEEPDFSGKRVGVIGTGSSGVQLIPIVAEEAEHLTVFLRTPNYTTQARNRPLTDEDYATWEQIRDQRRKEFRKLIRGAAGDLFIEDKYAERRLRPSTEFTREERQEQFNVYWQHGGAMVSSIHIDVLTNPEMNEELCGYFRDKIREVVNDPAKAEMLCPRGYPIGTRRIVVGSDFYETFNRNDVDLIDVKQTPIERFTEKGVIVGDKELEFDIIISASGFDAVTGSLTVMDIRGRGGQTLRDVWADGPHTYLGLGVSGFPNMLMIGGPGSPSLQTNVAMYNEVAVEWISDALTYARDNGYVEMEAEISAQEEWTEIVNNLLEKSLFSKADSWYVGTNVPGKKRAILTYLGGLPAYIEACDNAAANDYAGFIMTKEGALEAMCAR